MQGETSRDDTAKNRSGVTGLARPREGVGRGSSPLMRTN